MNVQNPQPMESKAFRVNSGNSGNSGKVEQKSSTNASAHRNVSLGRDRGAAQRFCCLSRASIPEFPEFPESALNPLIFKERNSGPRRALVQNSTEKVQNRIG